MKRLVSIPRQTLAALAAGAALAVSVVVPVAGQLPMPAMKDSGEAVYPAFEGWYANPDGSFNLLLGYYNRNQKQTLDIPVGPNNRVEPGGPDMGQPTYFQVRRGWGVFAIKVPKDFGSEKRYTWTIVANGKTASVPVGLIKDYQIEPFKDTAEGNTPPVLKFSPTGKTFQGPPLVIAHELTGTVGQPVTLEVDHHRRHAQGRGREPGVRRPHPAPRSSRGTSIAAPATFTVQPKQRPKIADDGKTSTTATFSAPGEYILRAQGNDNSGEGGGGFQCCWTNAYVKVTIK